MDSRSKAELAFGGMTGGDRMLHPGYAPVYSEYPRHFLKTDGHVVLAEFGVLRGTVLAIWCDLFPAGRIFGLDIDLVHFEENKADLTRRGAFISNRPEVRE